MKILGTAFIIIILLYGFQAWTVLANQEELLFEGAQLSEDRLQEVNNIPETEEVLIDTEDGETLHGWIKQSNEELSPLLIYFGGNGEEASQAMESHSLPENWAGLYINYRDYGKSSGTPSEQKLFEDSREIFDYAASRKDIDSSRIVVMGRSMGTASAAHLSLTEQTAGTILVSPYDTRTRLQQERFPYLPHGTFIRHPFEVSEMAEEINSPLLGITGTDDEVIPPSHSYETFSKWSGPVTTIELAGYHHNNLQQSPLFWEGIHSFLSDISSNS
ncbi:alpha/beta hydrolase [Alkalicoccus daliensis]|uniref:Peptidase S9 prolyl oligopeptidase catalytic domain-containing protein n=1 Tax=Alkalicoccus daliensis TaxID=745820 RepID=A0A1H0AZL0_9BACI|nr:prolyl oligopeptidase family serine peptidase [Alkalicoccus daliensis]SDN38483.1 hypothetical protein SAMN04488053_101675 [Alkalicoccus daliensis]